MLRVDGINVFYGELQALCDVSFEVKKGQLVAIIGSNGAGKTTILRTISGLLHPASGSIDFLGEATHNMPPHRLVNKGISYVPEGRKLFPKMTVLENLEMGAYTKEASKEMENTLEWVYQIFLILKERRQQLAGTLSGGEQQMLAIGRALMSKPRLLMLDEPSLGLAPMMVLKIFEVMEEIRKRGVTILLVEQNIHMTLRIADRGYLLENGRIVLEGEGVDLLGDKHIKVAYLGL